MLCVTTMHYCERHLTKSDLKKKFVSKENWKNTIVFLNRNLTLQMKTDPDFGPGLSEGVLCNNPCPSVCPLVNLSVFKCHRDCPLFWTPGLPEGVLSNHLCPFVSPWSVVRPWSVFKYLRDYHYFSHFLHEVRAP